MNSTDADGIHPFPPDWPPSGAIDLELHDPPHESSSVEWWYLHAHLQLEGGETVSVFASFFLIQATASGAEREGRKWRQHLVWATTMRGAQRHRSRVIVDPATARDGLERIDNGDAPGDPHVLEATRELFAAGRVPSPDVTMTKPGQVAWDRLEIDCEGNQLHRADDGSYVLTCQDEAGGFSLRFVPTKPPQRHGIDGHVNGFTTRSMFYYFQPRCDVTGHVTVEGRQIPVRHGQGWVDHEFGRHDDDREADELSFAWRWMAIQLDDGWDLTVYETFESGDESKIIERGLIIVSPEGERQSLVDDFELHPLDDWTSTRTFATYQVAWRLVVEGLDIDLVIRATLPDNEILTVLSAPAFWEGCVDVEGRRAGRSASGFGYVEQSGLSSFDTIEEFFSAVGRQTRHEVETLLPPSPDRNDLTRLFAFPHTAHWLHEVAPASASSLLLDPLRELVLRGGKAWRSFGLLACLAVVGGDPNRYRHWLALPELLHSGSLIIDDIQDQSDVRRGGPSCHQTHGVSTAINVGNAAYFLALTPLLKDELPPDILTAIYENYSVTMRAAHLGQGLDIAGLRDAARRAAQSGDAGTLQDQLLAIHRLKSGIPPAALARMAVRVAGGTPEQEESLGLLFEAYGVAFQIVDDVLNVRGFEGDLKSRGEDLLAGKITAPVALSLGRLDRAQRDVLWSFIRDEGRDAEQLSDIIDLLEGCGAMNDCMERARTLVEDAWARAEPLLVPSFPRVMLRAFGRYLLDRHY